ncbi:TIGR02270 family protein, partial [Corallococcus llansteffanensis]
MSRSTEVPVPTLTDIQRSVCAQHLDEAAFLWSQWETSLDSARLTLGDLHDIDERRLLAHLDALVLGGSAVREEFLTPALADTDPGLVTAAALALLAPESADDAPFHQVLEALVVGGPAPRPWLQRALEVSALPARVPAVRKLLEQEDPALVATALEVLGFWGVEAGTELSPWLAHPAPEVASAALRVARSTFGPVSPHLLARALESPHPRVQDEALITGLVLGIEPTFTLARCRQLAVLPEAPRRTALLLLAMGGETSDLRVVLEQLGRPEVMADALWALGFSGRMEAAEACLELLADPESGGSAAEAFGAITGLALEGPFLLPGEQEEDEEPARPAGPALPRARPEAVRQWWRETAHRLEPRGRYLLGRPLKGEWLLESFEHVPLRRRHAMALEVALRSRGAHLVQTRAFSGLQRAQLHAARDSARRWNLESPFRTLSTPWAAASRRPVPVPPAPPRLRPALPSSEALAVTGIGMVSALGEDAAECCAAGRAGVLRIM